MRQLDSDCGRQLTSSQSGLHNCLLPARGHGSRADFCGSEATVAGFPWDENKYRGSR